MLQPAEIGDDLDAGWARISARVEPDVVAGHPISLAQAV
jgi:hypothetical protein